MTLRQYSYSVGSGNGTKEHEDGTVETLYGDSAFTEDAKYVILPKDLGGLRVGVIAVHETACPVGCDTKHKMLILDHIVEDDTNLTVVECPVEGFLYCPIK